ncbi:MAG: hypothetical protein Q4A07_08615 [Coriobacteriales bacterium]|nr:hypothetical protein [Coriobacteriales bacterium]
MATAYDRGGEPSRAGDAVAALLGGALGKGLSAASKAARAWYAANGDRERAHTTGVWLRKPGRTGADPVLVVELDSNLLAYELGTNKDLYLSRMAFHGIAVSDIRFKVGNPSHGVGSRAAKQRGVSPLLGPKQGEHSPAPAPELTPTEAKRVERACAGLPDGLRQSVSRAMCASLRRSKSSSTQET